MGNIFVIGDAPFIPNMSSFISKDGQTSIQLPINESGYDKLISDINKLSLNPPTNVPIGFDFKRFIKLSAIYWIVKLFYSKIYFEGDFAQKANNDFRDVNITVSSGNNTNIANINTKEWFRTANIDDKIRRLSNFTSDELNQIIDCARTLCQYPKCVKNTDGSFTITIFSPFTNVGRAQEQEKDPSIFQNKLNRFLRDTELLIKNTQTNKDAYGIDCVLGEKSITQMIGVNPIDITIKNVEYGDVVYYTQDNTSRTSEILKKAVTRPIGMEVQLITPEVRIYPFVSKCEFKINKWSPMLAVYFSSISSDMLLTDSILQSIITEQNVCLLSYFQRSCVASNQSCLDSKKKFCSQTIQLPFSGDSSIFFVTQLNSQCLCINSLATPASSPNGNPTGMCFDKNCSTDELLSYGITDDNCKSRCDEMNAWDSNKIPLKNSSYVDKIKRTRLCNISAPPDPNTPSPSPIDPNAIWNTIFDNNTNTTKNNDVLGLSYILLILFIFLFFIQTTSFDKKNLLVIAIIYICVFYVLYNPLSTELKGESRCADVNKAICYSKNNYEIGDEFCDSQAVCECMFDENCSSIDAGCRCASGICISTGSSIPRKTTEENVYLPKKRLLLFCILISVLFFLAFKAYNPNVFSENVYFMIVVLLCSLPILFGLYKNQTKVRQVFSDKCCTPNCAGKKAGNDNGCGGVC